MPPKRKRVEEEVEEERDERDDESSGSGSDNSDGSSSDSDSNSGDSDNSDNDSDDGSNSGSDNDSDDSDDDGSDQEEEAPKKGAKGRASAAKTKKTVKKPATKASKATKTKSAKDSRAAATKKKATKAVKKEKKKSKSSESEDKPRKLKSLKKLDRLEEARKAYKWWEAPKHAKGINWRYLEHAGVAFAPAYEPHRIPLLYDGKPLQLTPEQEEVATFYAAMPLDGPQLGNPATKTVFDRNFFEDFKAVLGKEHIVKRFELLDFSAIRDHLNMQKHLKKVATAEEKQVKKEAKEAAVLKFGYALIDGRLEKMGNFNMEPPGLFRGRGAHPKTGKLKSRVLPESVALNLSEDAPVPLCTLPGHAWESVRHDPSVTWLCAWTENVQSQNKYVMLAASSSFKGQSDLEKYQKAITLKGCIHRIRADYTAKIQSRGDVAVRQLGVAMWVIDTLALRVGGEKGEDEADTVGCCSLRVEHFTFHPPAAGQTQSYVLDLEFLGKDSMLFKQTIDFSRYGALGEEVYRSLQTFCKGKKPTEDVFETLDPPKLNAHLSSLMKGLTAKVFRTFNASVTLEKELPTPEDLEGLPLAEKVLRYNAANREVAILCNHQRTVSKATETMFEALNEKRETLLRQAQELRQWAEWLGGKKKGGNASSIPLLDEEEEEEKTEAVRRQLSRAEEQRERAKTSEEKLAAAEALEAAKAAEKADRQRRLQNKHLFARTPSAEAVAQRLEKWQAAITKLETEIRNKEENKEVALGTSKINYMDPRISVAWCKRCEVPIDKVFARTLRDKFNWAMAVPPDWKFE